MLSSSIPLFVILPGHFDSQCASLDVEHFFLIYPSHIRGQAAFWCHVCVHTLQDLFRMLAELMGHTLSGSGTREPKPYTLILTGVAGLRYS